MIDQGQSGLILHLEELNYGLKKELSDLQILL